MRTSPSKENVIFVVTEVKERNAEEEKGTTQTTIDVKVGVLDTG